MKGLKFKKQTSEFLPKKRRLVDNVGGLCYVKFN